MKAVFLSFISYIAAQTTATDTGPVASQNCLYCKRADIRAGFMFSYSYCYDLATEDDYCRPDAWNYIKQNLNCATGFK